MTPWTIVHQAPPSMGFSRQEYWSGLPFPSPNQSINRYKCTKFKIGIPNYHSTMFYQRFPWVFPFPFVLAVPHTLCREDNGNPLQYSCLGNPMDRGAWWAAVYGVAQCWTRLKQLSSSSSSNKPLSWGFPVGTTSKEPTCQCRRDIREPGSVPG